MVYLIIGLLELGAMPLMGNRRSLSKGNDENIFQSHRKMVWHLEMRDPRGLAWQETAQKTLLYIWSKGFVMIDCFSSAQYLVFKISLICRNLQLPSLQNAFGYHLTNAGPVRPAKNSEPFLWHRHLCLLNILEEPNISQPPTVRRANWLVLTNGQGTEGTSVRSCRGNKGQIWGGAASRSGTESLQRKQLSLTVIWFILDFAWVTNKPLRC